jgi:subtilisin family serine protease
VRIRSYKVLDEVGSGYVSDTIAALDHLADNYPDTDVVTLSLGGDTKYGPGSCDNVNPAYTAAIDALRANGTMTFAAAGNDGFKDGMILPACITTAVSVGMTHDVNFTFSTWFDIPCTDMPAPVDTVACASNSDSSLDLLAPGQQITSSHIGGGTRVTGGTSQAAPHAAAAAALVWQAAPGLTADQVESCLEQNGLPIEDNANGITKPRVDVLACIESLGPGPLQVAWGDGNCSGAADPVDSLLTLRHDAGLGVNTGACPDFGDVVDVLNASLHPWGDVDCSGLVNPIDSLKLLRFDAGLGVSQAANCPQLGSQVTIES